MQLLQRLSWQPDVTKRSVAVSIWIIGFAGTLVLGESRQILSLDGLVIGYSLLVGIASGASP